MVVIYDKEVIHKNKKMFDVTGETNLNVWHLRLIK